MRPRDAEQVAEARERDRPARALGSDRARAPLRRRRPTTAKPSPTRDERALASSRKPARLRSSTATGFGLPRRAPPRAPPPRLARSPSAGAAPGRVEPCAPRRSTAEQRQDGRRPGLGGSSSPSGMPGSSGGSRARRAARATVGAQLLEPRRARRTSRRRARRAARPARARRGEQPAGLQLLAGDRRVDGRADDRLRVAALEQLEPRGVEAARRRRVEHDAAADGRLGAQDDAVAAGGDDRLASRSCAKRPLAHDAGRDVARAEVDRDARPATRLELLERDVEPVADRIGAGLDERVAAPQLRALDARAAPTATRCPASARSTGRSCTWTLRTRTSQARPARRAARRPRRSSPTRACR